MISQILLILLLGFPLLLAIYFFRNKQLNKLIILGSFFLIGFLLLFPATSNRLLSFLGLESRIEVVMYLSFGLFSFLFIYLYAKYRQLERRQTEFIRMMALKEVQKPQ